MSSLRFFLDLLQFIDSSARELGVDGLTESDRQVLNTLWKVADHNSGEASLSYERFMDNEIEAGSVSRSQFFKSLKKLEESNLISRVAGPRSSSYRLNIES